MRGTPMKEKTSDQYRHQVNLLLQVLPIVFEQSCYCLKGGTAINLFIQDMPGLSVDIDLVYMPIKNRSDSLGEIESTLLQIKKSI